MFTLEHAGRTYLNATADDLLANGVPQAAIDAHIGALRLSEVKAECTRRIDLVANRYARENVANFAQVIDRKAASARSDQEKAIIVGQEKGVQWIMSMRAAIAALAADPKADFTADDAWPKCPVEAAAVYGQF